MKIILTEMKISAGTFKERFEQGEEKINEPKIDHLRLSCLRNRMKKTEKKVSELCEISSRIPK